MHSQHKNLIEKIKEVLPKEKDYKEIKIGDNVSKIDYYNGYNNCLQNCISSLPQIMEVIKRETDKRMLSFFC